MLNGIKTYLGQVFRKAEKQPQPVRRPVPPNRVSTASLKAQKHKDILRSIEEELRKQPAKPVGVPRARVVSRGNNKNVYVIAPEDINDDEALRVADQSAVVPALQTEDSSVDTGFDPYNSGVFHQTPSGWRATR